MKEKESFFTRKKKEAGICLNDVQIKAVSHTEGPILLLASPGSGKTTTIIMRIGYLIEEKKVDPSRIKAVTFSRAAAEEMKKRYSQFFPGLPSVDFSTIHSFSFQVVQAYFRKIGMPYQIIEGNLHQDKKEIAAGQPGPLHKKNILRELFYSITGEQITDDQLDELTTYISFIKNKMIPSQGRAKVKSSVPNAEQILQEYELFKESAHPKLLDFDDMLVEGNKALEQNEDLLRKYQKQFDYILVDESQDTSLVQHAIIEKLARTHKNLCVVADDDQSIYSWRGAEPSYLLNFKNTYPTASILFMEQNYRSSSDIVKTANQFIKRNKQRYEKNMFTENPSIKPIQIKSFSHYSGQSNYLVEELKKLGNLSETAVLYRNNSSSIALINEFDRAEIPFYIKDADNRFFSHWVVEDVLNFMRMTFTDKRPDLLEKIHLKFHGYISKQQMADLKACHTDGSVFDTLLTHVHVHDYQVNLLKESKETFRKMKGMPPAHAIRMIRNRLGYEQALGKICGRLGFKKEYLISILNTLEKIAEPLDSMEAFAKRLAYLETVLKTAKSQSNKQAVTLSTFHSAKGLEFERVYLIDLVEGIFPSSEDQRSEVLMEEAVRLFYVGMTRAKKHLELTLYWERDGEKTAESSFVSAVRNIITPVKQPLIPDSKGTRKSTLNPKAIRSKAELIPGKKVAHKKFGTGIIKKIQEETIFIQFGEKEKTLLAAACLEMGLLEPISS